MVPEFSLKCFGWISAGVACLTFLMSDLLLAGAKLLVHLIPEAVPSLYYLKGSQISPFPHIRPIEVVLGML